VTLAVKRITTIATAAVSGNAVAGLTDNSEDILIMPRTKDMFQRK
jgi:hypothetical protein